MILRVAGGPQVLHQSTTLLQLIRLIPRLLQQLTLRLTEVVCGTARETCKETACRIYVA